MSVGSCSQCNSINPSLLNEACSQEHLSHIQCIFDSIRAGKENCLSCTQPFLDRWFIEFYATSPNLQPGLQSENPYCLSITSMQKRRINQAIKENNQERIQTLTQQGIEKGIKNLWEALLSEAVVANDLNSVDALLAAHQYENFDIFMSINRQENANSSEGENTPLQILKSLLTKSNFHPKFLLPRLEKAISNDEHQIKAYLLSSISLDTLLDEALLEGDEDTLNRLSSIMPKEHLFKRLEKAISENDTALIQPLSALLKPFQKPTLFKRSPSSTSV